MARVYLVRHGQASLGSDNYDQLSALGMQQAQLLGAYFKLNHIPVDQVICGTQTRHQQTAQHFYKGYQKSSSGDGEGEFLTMAGFNEYDFEAMIQAYIKQHPEQNLNMHQGPDLFRLLKKCLLSWSKNTLTGELEESWPAFQQRVWLGLQQVQADHYHQNIVIFSSGGPIASMVSQLLEAPSHVCIELNFQIHNTSVTQCYVSQEKITLQNFNGIPHLQDFEHQKLQSYS